MQFVLLIYHGTSPLPGTPAWESLPESERKRIYAEYGELNKTTGVTGAFPAISPTKATTVEVRDGRVQTKDGPHLAEGVGGALVLEAANLEAAIAVAAKIPQARLGGAIEVRPCEKYF